MKNLMSVLRELSLEEIREEAERPPSILILSDNRDDALALAENLTGLHHSHYVTTSPLSASIENLDSYDAIIIFDPHARNESKLLLDRVASKNKETAVVPYLSFDPKDEKASATLRTRILGKIPDRVPSFGRSFPAFRAAAVKSVVDDTAMANAQFALISNVPSLVPVIGAMATATADFLVLTKNQLLLLFKIAAIHNRDLHDKTAIIREMVPVVGAGLFWRTLAREATVFLPFAAGSVPKVVIAYSGTVAVGKAADYYYRYGEKPSKDQVKTFYQQGMEALKRRGFPLRGNGKTVDADYRIVEIDESGISENEKSDKTRES
jgi:uncharacterized protein (DUF697 family)